MQLAEDTRTVDNPAAANRWDAVVIGGGFYGACVALDLKKRMERVVLLERGRGLLQRASYANQARVHNGYHYPRSILTSMRSRLSYTKFCSDFGSCVDDSFTKVYAVSRRMSKVNAQQFTRFCQRIGADISPAPRDITSLFDTSLIEAAFIVTECAFNARLLETALAAALRTAGVHIMLGANAECISRTDDGGVAVSIAGRPAATITASHAFNCTYSGLNRLLRASSLPVVPLKHELAELAMVELPPELEGLGITVMDGPFFSTMPFPATGLHSLSHVRFTPHRTWSETDDETTALSGEMLVANPPPSNFPYMLRDAARYVPRIAAARYVESLWEVKTILPRSEQDDGRPVLLHRSPGAQNIWSVLGAKIDGVYDVQAILNEALDTIDTLGSPVTG